ncbi:sigma-70 family RNA polymerase sigma factor [Gangjinia marincola]|uniref:Sigma-70 family RNA polymerase sigma factor n=1 Tax=Gangjinia marincola TaxID=578463 RepID=A0ABP3XQI2_9FLAO
MLQTGLIDRCRENDRKAQLTLYNKYSEGMYYVAYRFLKDSFEAEDAMQEGFISAFSKLHQFTGDVTFGAWLKRIVINKSIDKLKAKKATLVSIDEGVMAVAEEDQGWEVSEGIEMDHIKAEIEALPEKYRCAIMLFLVEGYDHEEISEILGITQVTSRTLVHRGKKKLINALQEVRYGTGS